MMAGHHDDVPHPAGDGIKLPHSLEAEREVLASIFVQPACMARVGMLSPADFYADRHRLVFAAQRELYSAGFPIDPVTVSQHMRDVGTFERAGGMRAIGEAIDGYGTTDHLEHYVAIVLDKARLRRVIETARHVETQALQDVEDVTAFVDGVKARFERMSEAIKPAPSIALRTLAEYRMAGDDWLGQLPNEAAVLLKTRDGAPFVRDSRVGLLVAPGGTGKTFALIDLARAIASGGSWFDHYPVQRKGKVLLALGEEDNEEIRRRLYKATRYSSDYERAEVERNLVPLGLMGQRIGLMERGADGNARASAWYGQLTDQLTKSGPWRCIILDPWSRWGGPEVETDAHAATLGVSMLEALTKLPGSPAVIVAHHTRKSIAGMKQDANDTRGSSAFVDGARWVANMSRKGKTRLIELAVTKANYTVPGEPLLLARGEGGTLRAATPAELEEANA